IELVPVKAKAGYTNGFSDPEFIENLPAFRMPMLRSDRKYRTFPISGDSMLPIPDGSWVTGEYVDDWRNLKIGEAYIFVTSSEGIVFKILDGKLSDGRVLELKSLNPLYKNYEVPIDEMKEVWHFVHYISEEIPEPQLSKDGMMSGLLALQEQMQMVTKKLNLN
ncbi:MAG: S24 family peptidase, partial [Flexibacteraceae bacterium]